MIPFPPEGAIDGARHLYAVRAHYEDTDLSGVVYHANYLRWFERARSDLLRLLGSTSARRSRRGRGPMRSPTWRSATVRPPGSTTW